MCLGFSGSWRGIVDAACPVANAQLCGTGVGTEVRKYNILLPHQLSAGSHESTTNTVGDSHNAVDGVEADDSDVTQNN